jgi:hypothetical protein
MLVARIIETFKEVTENPEPIKLTVAMDGARALYGLAHLLLGMMDVIQ